MGVWSLGLILLTTIMPMLPARVTVYMAKITRNSGDWRYGYSEKPTRTNVVTELWFIIICTMSYQSQNKEQEENRRNLISRIWPCRSTCDNWYKQQRKRWWSWTLQCSASVYSLYLKLWMTLQISSVL